jgi:hypothetical protein
MAFSIAKRRSIYIYDVKISGFTRSSIYIYDISRLRVNIKTIKHQYNDIQSFSDGIRAKVYTLIGMFNVIAFSPCPHFDIGHHLLSKCVVVFVLTDNFRVLYEACKTINFSYGSTV